MSTINRSSTSIFNKTANTNRLMANNKNETGRSSKNKVNSMIEYLIKQKQSINENRSTLISRTLEKGQNMDTIKEQLDVFDEQIKSEDEQISKTMLAEQQKALENIKKYKKYSLY